MFHQWFKLSDIKPLKNWNVSNGKNFSGMFCCCYMLSKSDMESLNWNVSNEYCDIDALYGIHSG